ncbi:MAG: DUF3108 domain-containing protein [Planctomycetota bacterium]|nr:DUF3108 domain-containing protein [Planctomycetota bacterium]
MRLSIPLILCGFLTGTPGQEDVRTAAAPTAPAGSGSENEIIVELDGFRPLHLQRGEELVYTVHVGFGIVAASVGKVVLSTGTEPYRESVLLLGSNHEEDERETVWMRAYAKGTFEWYSMDATIESRLHPVDWPQIVYTRVHRGGAGRRRQLLIGTQEGNPFVRYRRDTSTGAPRGTRIWKQPKERELPAAALDMLTSIYYARTLIRENLYSMRFPLVDKTDLWQIDLRRGKIEVQETYAGDFDSVELTFEPKAYSGEKLEKEAQFEGLFGIHGSIHLWVDSKTGVPVRVQGDLPIGPFDLGIDVILKSYRGTPVDFRPRR